MTRWLHALALFSMLGCSSNCDLAQALRARAGNGAKDCGIAAVGTDASAVDACVIAAFASGEAFVARYGRQGTDSAVVFGVAGDSHRQIAFLQWDSDPSGGSGAAPVISGDVCIGPAVNASSNRDPFTTAPLTCTSTSPLGRTCG